MIQTIQISVFVCECAFTVYHAFVSGCVLQDVEAVLESLNTVDKVSVISCVCVCPPAYFMHLQTNCRQLETFFV